MFLRGDRLLKGAGMDTPQVVVMLFDEMIDRIEVFMIGSGDPGDTHKIIGIKTYNGTKEHAFGECPTPQVISTL